MTMFYKNFLREEAGQDLIEYSLLLAFMTLFAVGTFTLVGQDVGTIWTSAQAQTSAAAAITGSGS